MVQKGMVAQKRISRENAMKFVESLLCEVKEVNVNDVANEKLEEIRPDDKVLGALSDDLKRLYVVMRRRSQECEMAHKEEAVLRDKIRENNGGTLPKEQPEEHVAIITKCNRLNFEHSFLHSWFWMEIKAALPASVNESELNLGDGFRVFAPSKTTLARRSLTEFNRLMEGFLEDIGRQ